MPRCGLILHAAEPHGSGTTPPALYELLFRPLLSRVLDNCRAAGFDEGFVWRGIGDEAVQPLIPDSWKTDASPFDYLKNSRNDCILLLYADMPFLTPEDITGLLDTLWDGTKPFLLKGGDAMPGAGLYPREMLLELLQAGKSPSDAASMKYSGTDPYAHDVEELALLRVKNRRTLSEATEILRWDVLEKHLEKGVNIPVSDGVVIGEDVVIGPDSTIHPGTILKGRTTIGDRCEIGPNSHLTDSTVGNGCTVISSYIDSSRVESRVKIGPMSNIRPGSRISDGVKIGDFVEIKNSTIGVGTSVSHLTYIGDSDVGSGCNFGCGVVTVNYDGTSKHRTVVGDNTFVGCNVNLVAPVKLGDRVYAAAGTTVTENVPDDALVIGRARQTVKEGWRKRKGLFEKK